MDIAVLPNDVNVLKEIITELQQKYDSQTKTLHLYQEQVKILKDKIFGRKSEKISDKGNGQLYLFNELENDWQETKKTETTKVTSYTRRKRGRKPLPKDLKRIQIIHDLTDEEKIHGCGRVMNKIREEKTEKLKIIPEQLVVEEHIRYVYACECEGVDTEGKEGAIRIAPLPPQIIPKSIATPSLLAYILTSKFCDALPFYRQEKMFLRRGIDLSRQNMSYWAIQVYDKYKILQELMKEDIRGGPLIGMDETTVQVMNEEGRENTAKSYMWVARGGKKEKPVLLYNYFPYRNGKFVKDFLKGYAGYVQSDGYNAYNSVKDEVGITLAGCWAHARRKFVDVTKAAKADQKTEIILRYIKKLYKVEKECRLLKYTADKIKEMRQKKSKPIIEEKIRPLIDELMVTVPPKTTLGKAVHYLFNEWDELNVYLEDGNIPIDNNLVENAIRPFVVGRKNWLFSVCPDGASASAFLYSLIETAKANDLEPYWYLLYLFEKLPGAVTEDDFRALLPYVVTKADLLAHFISTSKTCG